MTEISRAAQVARLGGDVVSVKDFGAVGDGVTDDTAAFVSAYDLITSKGGGKIFVPQHPVGGFYLIDPLVITSDNVEIHHESKNTHVKLKPQDFAVLSNTGVYQPQGSSGNLLQGFKCFSGKLDGNKGNHINEIANAHVDHEVIDLKYCKSAIIEGCVVINAHSEGIDLDSSVGTVVIDNEVDNCGGYGIHNSLDSTYSQIHRNRVTNCGFDKLRGGIDAFKSSGSPALYGSYSGNYCDSNYRNYNIKFDDDPTKLKSHSFDSSNISIGTTTEVDSLSGVKAQHLYSDTPELIFDRGNTATGAHFIMSDANTLELRERKVSDTKDDTVLSFKILNGGGIDIPSASGGIDISPATGTKWRFKRNGGDGFLEAMNDESGSMTRVFAISKAGDIHLTGAGKGLVLTSPDGLTTRKLTIDNSGALSIIGV